MMLGDVAAAAAATKITPSIPSCKLLRIMCGIWRGAKGKCCMKKIFEKLKQNFLSCLLFVKLINYNFEYSIKCNKFKYFKIIILYQMKKKH